MTTVVWPSESWQEVLPRLEAGEVVALPSETVYGLAGNALEERALGRIFEAKGRPTSDPLIIHLPVPASGLPTLRDVRPWISAERLEGWSTRRREQLKRVMERCWPGPLTMILPKSARIPFLATSGRPSVALRMPAHPLFQKVLARLSFPLAAPSANRFGGLSPTNAQAVLSELGGRIAGVLDGGACDAGVESSILSWEPLGLLRPGAFSKEFLEGVLEEPLPLLYQSLVGSTEASLAPGLTSHHYAPRKSLFLLNQPLPRTPEGFQQALDWIQSCLQQPWGGLFFGALPTPIFGGRSGPVVSKTLSLRLEEATPLFFETLRSLDQNPECACLVSEPCPSLEGYGLALTDRLQRAQSQILLLPLFQTL